MRKRSYAILALMLILAFIVSSCGASKTTSTGTKQEKKDLSTSQLIKATNPEKLPAIAKNRADTLVVGTKEMEGKFLSIYAITTYDQYVVSLTSDPLLLNNDKAEMVPAVAEKWETSPDQKTYTFHLKKGIKFSNGDELTADDVAFTYTAVADPKYDGPVGNIVDNLVGYKEYHNGQAKEVSGIKVIDKYTISFTESKIKASAFTTDFGYGIIPKKIYNFEKGNIQQLRSKMGKPVGSGAYVFKIHKPGQEVELQSNPEYFKGAPKIKNIILKVVTNQTVIQELSAGGVDMARIATTPESADMLKKTGFIDLQVFPLNGYSFICFNCRRDMFKDKKVRQALYYGLNRKAFIDSFYKGYAALANTAIASSSWAYPSDINPYEYNPEKAKQLLDEAGWKMGDDGFRHKDGKKFSVQWSTSTGGGASDILIPLLKANWKKIGVDVTPELMDFGTLSAKTGDKQDFDIFDMAWTFNGSTEPDMSSIFSITQAEPGGSNNGGWTTPESEKLMQDGLTTLDQNKRAEIYKKWFKLVNEELPYIFLCQQDHIWGVSSRVKNLSIGTYTDFTYYINNVELAK